MEDPSHGLPPLRMFWKGFMHVFKGNAGLSRSWHETSRTWSDLQLCVQTYMGCKTTILHAGTVKASSTVKNDEVVACVDTEVLVVLNGDPNWVKLGALSLLTGLNPTTGVGYYEWPEFKPPQQSSWMPRVMWDQDAVKRSVQHKPDELEWARDVLVRGEPTVFGGPGARELPPLGVAPLYGSDTVKMGLLHNLKGQWCRSCEERGCALEVTLLCRTCGSKSLFLERSYSPMGTLDFVDVATLSQLKVCCQMCEGLGLGLGPGDLESLVPPHFLLPVVDIKCGKQVRDAPRPSVAVEVRSIPAETVEDQMKHIHVAVSSLLRLRLPEETPFVGIVFVKSPWHSVVTLGPGPEPEPEPESESVLGVKYTVPGFLG